MTTTPRKRTPAKRQAGPGPSERWTIPTGLRDSLCFSAGLLGLLHETVLVEPRPVLLPFFVGMLGLPAFLHADEHRRGK